MVRFRTGPVVIALGIGGCAGDGGGKDTDSGITTGDIDVTGLWSGSCTPFATTSGTASIHTLTLDLVDTGGVLSGTWDSVALVGTGGSSSTTESYAITGTRTGPAVALVLDTDYTITLDGMVDGDEMNLTLTLSSPDTTTYVTKYADCTLTR